MFNKNKNIKVGRDININIEKNNLEQYNQQALIKKEKEANLILKKEAKRKFKATLIILTIAFIIFIFIYLITPFLVNNYVNKNNKIYNFLIKIVQDEKTMIILSGLASVVTIITPLSDLWKSNHIEKKQYEVLKTIKTILKEREYLKK